MYKYQRGMVVNTLWLHISMHITCLSPRYYIICQPWDCSFFQSTQCNTELTPNTLLPNISRLKNVLLWAISCFLHCFNFPSCLWTCVQFKSNSLSHPQDCFYCCLTMPWWLTIYHTCGHILYHNACIFTTKFLMMSL